jgi:carbon storage regulator CsrA
VKPKKTGLVLTRKKDEVVYLDGGRIAITVVHIGPGRVKLHFVAPPEISIHRGEIAEASVAEVKEGAA